MVPVFSVPIWINSFLDKGSPKRMGHLGSDQGRDLPDLFFIDPLIGGPGEA